MKLRSTTPSTQAAPSQKPFWRSTSGCATSSNQQRGPDIDFGLRVHHFDRFAFSLIYEEHPSGPHI